MTLWDLFGALRRRWPVVLVGVLLTGTLGFLAISQPDVYWTRSKVVFLAPSSREYPNSLRTTSEDLVIMAGVISKRVAGPDKLTKYASPEADLVGIGVREGWSIRLPDTGGQWAPNFASQELMVEVVGTDRIWVEDTRDLLIQRIRDELATIQADAKVDPVNLITVRVVPDPSVTVQVGGSGTRALAMTGILGVLGTLAVVILLEYLQQRRDGRRRSTEVEAEAADQDPVAVC